MKLTENFRLREFRCLCADRGFATDDTWCGGESWPHRELVDKLQELRDRLNKGVPKKYERRIDIESGCRCPRYNGEGLEAQGYSRGAPRSQHKRGTAADIKVFDRQDIQIEPSLVAQAARELGLYVLEYPTFTHVDIRNSI